MFAIAFDLVVADTAQHPKGVSQAYADIGSTLAGSGLDRVPGSLDGVRRPRQPVRRDHGAHGPALAASFGARLPRRAVVGFHRAGEGMTW